MTIEQEAVTGLPLEIEHIIPQALLRVPGIVAAVRELEEVDEVALQHRRSLPLRLAR